MLRLYRGGREARKRDHGAHKARKKVLLLQFPLEVKQIPARHSVSEITSSPLYSEVRLAGTISMAPKMKRSANHFT